MIDHQPWMSADEVALLERTILPSHRVFEWGSGGSTEWLARRCKHVTTAEHSAFHAAKAVLNASHNVSVLYIPPDQPYIENGEDDGDLATFKTYVEAPKGGADVYVVDGRARIECCKYIRERAQVGPADETLIFLHDFYRHEEFFQGYPALEVAERVGELALLKVRW